MNFPEFMVRKENMIPADQQNTPDIDGYYYTANDGSQMAFWIYKADRVSKEHTHDYDEYTSFTHCLFNLLWCDTNAPNGETTCIKRTLLMRSWLSVYKTDGKSMETSDIPIAPSLYSLSNKIDNILTGC